MRKVVLTIEVNTCMRVEELKDLQSMVFGAMRSDNSEGKRRSAIKRTMPIRHRDDVLGTIEQVQVNVIGK
jgi:hypothetical protein